MTLMFKYSTIPIQIHNKYVLMRKVSLGEHVTNKYVVSVIKELIIGSNRKGKGISFCLLHLILLLCKITLLCREQGNPFYLENLKSIQK